MGLIQALSVIFLYKRESSPNQPFGTLVHLCRRTFLPVLLAKMAGSWQPYLYQPQTDSMDLPRSTFNPKALTIASRMPPSPTKKQPDGPLISFNRHPDSYLVLPYGNTDAKPMNRRTKTFIKIARGIQLACRVCELVGAVGVLLCSIFIRGALDTEGWIVRVPVCGVRHVPNVFC